MSADFLDRLALLADPAATAAKYKELQDAVHDTNRKLAHAATEQSKFDEELRAHQDRLAALSAEQRESLQRETNERRQELDDRESTGFTVGMVICVCAGNTGCATAIRSAHFRSSAGPSLARANTMKVCANLARIPNAASAAAWRPS
jgi:chromosome segregation ATPase